MSTAGFDLVDWDAIDLAIVGFPEMFWLWASKHMSHFCGVGRMQFICRFWDHSRCPRCQQDNETTEHIILCNGHGANQEWTSRVTNLGVWLIEMDTHPSIHHCISESLMQRSPLTSFISHSDLVCHSATLEQDGIGWQNFVEGKISKHWGYLQLLYYHELHSKRSVNKWTSGLVSHLLELTHGMWVHRNGIDHAVDKQGLPIRLAANIEATIHEEFCKGTDGLARHDFHFIRRGRDNVMSLSTVDKQGWLRGIQLARDSRITAPPAHRQQQQLMQDFFHTADN
jgi:hypothetical protein